METGLDRRAMIPHKTEGRPKDLPKDLEYAVRPDYQNANLRQAFEAMGIVMFTGIMCEDGGHYGASTTTKCSLTLPDDFTAVGDVLHIGDGTREWRVSVLVENNIEFTDTDLIYGSPGTNNYNTIQNLLLFWTMSNAKLRKVVTKNEICLGSFAEGVHADDIQRTNADTDKVGDLFTSYEKEHIFDPGGASDGQHISQAVQTIVFHIATLQTADDMIVAQWTPKQKMVLQQTDAYANEAPSIGDAVIRLTDAVDNVDTTIYDGTNLGSNTSPAQEFAAGVQLELKVLANSLTYGKDCSVVIQYSMV